MSIVGVALAVASFGLGWAFGFAQGSWSAAKRVLQAWEASNVSLFSAWEKSTKRPHD